MPETVTRKSPLNYIVRDFYREHNRGTFRRIHRFQGVAAVLQGGKR